MAHATDACGSPLSFCFVCCYQKTRARAQEHTWQLFCGCCIAHSSRQKSCGNDDAVRALPTHGELDSMMNPQRRSLLAIVAAMALVATSVISLKWLRAPAVEARRDVAPPFPSVGQHTKEPTPTGAWFTNLLLDDGAPSVSTPYAVRFEKKTHALEISYPSNHRAITKDNIADSFVADLIIKTEKLVKPELVSHDELTASFRFGDAQAYFARGSPFVTIALDAGSSLTIASVQSLKLQGSTTRTTTTAPIATSNRPQDDASCKAHPVCSNLIGVCCPTAEGVFLGCCEAGRRRLSTASKRHKVTLGDGSTSVWKSNFGRRTPSTRRASVAASARWRGGPRRSPATSSG